MTPEGHSRACERARTWAALAPDGELSQLEVRLLQAHLDRCPGCARVAVDIEAISEAIRTAPLEPPPAQIALPVLRRRSLRHRLPVTSAAGRLAAVAAVGLLAFTVGSWSSNDIVGTVPVQPLLIDEADAGRGRRGAGGASRLSSRCALSETSAAPRVGSGPGRSRCNEPKQRPVRVP